MGIDVIEIFFLLESEFQVSLDDLPLEHGTTMDDLYQVILRALRAEGRPVGENDVWWRMVGTIVYVTRDDPAFIFPSTPLLSLSLE